MILWTCHMDSKGLCSLLISMKEILITQEERLSLFQEKNLLYLKRTVVLSDKLTQFDWGTSEYYEANRDEFVRLTETYGPAIHNSELAPIFLKYISPQVGWGVFAREAIKENAFIGEYTGYLIEEEDAPPVKNESGNYLSDFSWNYPDELPSGEEFEISAFRAGNELRFVNHSFDPNCVVDHTLVDGIFITFFRAIDDIAPGEQLFIDYGEEYWSGGFRTLETL